MILTGMVVLDWRDVRRCLPAALAGLVLAGVLAGLPDLLRPLELTDTGPIRDNLGLTLFMQAINGPILAVWYVQQAGRSKRVPVARTLIFTGLTTCWAWMGAAAGRIECASWCSPLLMGFLYFMWYVLVWQVHVIARGYALVQDEGSPSVGG